MSLVIEEFDPSETEQDMSFYTQPVLKPKDKLKPQEAFIRTAKIFAPAGFGLLLIFFGLTSTGSYFTSASKFGGFLAEWFYGWQLGNLMAMIGVVLIYDSIRRAGYL